MHTQESSIYLSALIACVVLAVILGYFARIVFGLQQKYYQLKEKELTTEIDVLQKERIRIASDLHDELGPLLNLTLKQIEAVRLRNEGTYYTNQAEENLATVLKRMGEIARDLNDSRIIVNELERSIDQFLSQYSFESDITFNFQYEVKTKLSSTITIQVYRMIQELVNNTIRHANATIHIRFREFKNKIYIYYTDDGGGSVPFKETGIGIKSIKNRVRQLSGRLKIENNQGVAFFFEIPLQNKK